MRLARHGAQSVSGVTPDLPTWGMAVGRVFAVSALAGKPELMEAEPQRGCAAGLPLVHQRRRDDRPASSGRAGREATPCPGERVTDHAGTAAVMRPTGASALATSTRSSLYMLVWLLSAHRRARLSLPWCGLLTCHLRCVKCRCHERDRRANADGLMAAIRQNPASGQRRASLSRPQTSHHRTPVGPAQRPGSDLRSH
jgi:hypothetical protein